MFPVDALMDTFLIWPAYHRISRAMTQGYQNRLSQDMYNLELYLCAILGVKISSGGDYRYSPDGRGDILRMLL
jgi:hypothetical protein